MSTAHAHAYDINMSRKVNKKENWKPVMTAEKQRLYKNLDTNRKEPTLRGIEF